MAPVERRRGSLTGSRLVALALSGLSAGFALTPRCAVVLSTLAAFLLGGHSAVRAQTREAASNYENVQIWPAPHHQSEMSIAINPQDPSMLMIGANVGNPGEFSAGCYCSGDGGWTWTGDENSPPALYSSDPSTAFTAQGYALYCNIRRLPGETKKYVRISRADSASCNWTMVSQIPDSIGTLTYPTHDRPSIVADLSGPLYDRNLYVVYTKRFTTHDWDVFFSRSTSQEPNFGTPINLSAGIGGYIGSTYFSPEWGAAVVVGPQPDSDICVAFPITTASCGTNVTGIAFTRSTDKGISFPAPVVITDSLFRGIDAEGYGHIVLVATSR